MAYTIESLNRLSESLDATGVLSVQYRTHVMSMALSAVSEAAHQERKRTDVRKVRRMFVLLGVPDYDDSQWVDSLHDSAGACANSILDRAFTPTGRLRTGRDAPFPNGYTVQCWEPDHEGGWVEQEEREELEWKSPGTAEVHRLIGEALLDRRS